MNTRNLQARSMRASSKRSRRASVVGIALALVVVTCACDNGGDVPRADAGLPPRSDGGPSDASGPSDAGGSWSLVNAGIRCDYETEQGTVRIGGDCSAIISAINDADLGEPIVLSVDALPPGVTAEISNVEPGGLVPGTSSSLHLHVRGAAPTGPLEVVVRGTTSSHGSSTVTYSVTVTSLPGFVLESVAVGYRTSCGLDADGKAYCWGDNQFGQLGIGTSGLTNDYARMKPTEVIGGIRFSKIAPGGRTTCGLAVTGQAYCWGTGWLGNGTVAIDPVATPTQVSGGATFVDLANTDFVRCGITTAGAVHCWGGQNGYLGNGTYDNAAVPTDVSDGRTYRSLAAYEGSTCALTTGGTAYCWGSNAYGHVGDGTTMRRLSPTMVNTSLLFQSIAMSTYGTCGLTDESKVHCWGSNAAGYLGIGASGSGTYLSPTPTSGDLTFTAIAGGGGGFCALDEQGRAYCWGFVASEESSSVLVPTLEPGELTFSQISVGDMMSCGIAANGLEATYCWLGSSGNYGGYLGTGDMQSYSGPVPISAP